MAEFFQKEIRLTARVRGFHLVTEDIISELAEPLRQTQTGLLHLFLQHTSASLSMNENADPDVRVDMQMAIAKIVPEGWAYKHSAEGPDDMPAHIKASLLGTQLTIPIRKGRLCMGTWQGIYLGEHRDHGGPRRLVATIHGH